MKKPWRFCISAMLGAMAGLAMGAVAPDKSKLSPHVIRRLGVIESNKAAKKATGGVDALIVLKEQANLARSESIGSKEEKSAFVYRELTRTAAATQGELVEILRGYGAQYQVFHIANMIAVFQASSDLIAQLSLRSEVEKIISNDQSKTIPAVRLDRIPSNKDAEAIGPNLTAIGVDKVWSEFGVKGAGIVVAGQDTGVQWDHPALKANYRGTSAQSVDHNLSWFDAIRTKIGTGENTCGYDLKVPCDDNAHGTHTIGTVAGSDGGQNQIGVAPESKWIACRNMDAGVGRPSTYIDCFEWFLAPYGFGESARTAGKPEAAPDVINNSWGCPPDEGCREAEILPVLENLAAAGILVVASAGNDGPSCSTIANPPAMHSATSLSVGAHDHRNGSIAEFSSRGPSLFDGAIGPDVTAPGVAIRSAVPGGGYSGFFWSGTSMAGPHVAGLVALMWSASTELRGNITKTVDLIRSTAVPTTLDETCGGVSGNEVPNNTFGYGRIDAYAAVKAALGR